MRRASRRAEVAPAKRPRNAVVTKDAILQSALVAFSRAGYDGVGLREIAREAGVTAVLVSRYFGSKEDLFAAVAEVVFSQDQLFSGDFSTLAQRVASAITQKASRSTEPVDPLLLILRSAPNVRAAEILRKSIERHFERPLAQGMSGDDVRVRAAMFLAVIAGYQLMRGVISSTALADADQGVMSVRLAALFQVLVEDGSRRRSDVPR